MTAQHLKNTLLLIILLLMAVGLVMVYSTSAVVAQMDPKMGTSYFFVKKQLVWIMLAGAAMLACMEVPYRLFARYGYVIFWCAFLLLILVLIPGIGTKYNGARRWLRMAGMGFQPSDFMKIAMIIFIARYAEKNITLLQHFAVGFLPVFAAVSSACFLILLEPDFGTCCFIMLVATILMLVTGIRWQHFIPVTIVSLPLILYLVVFKLHHIARRINTYLNPDLDPWGAGYQIRQALIAIGSGGKYGVGLGWSKQKLFFLSEESTDFIFAILGEELGLMGTALVVLLYILFVYYGFQVVRYAPDIFSTIVALGIVLAISLQSVFNISVATHTLPAKGISLPLISFGGSGLLFTMIQAGILVNIAGCCNCKKPISWG